MSNPLVWTVFKGITVMPSWVVEAGTGQPVIFDGRNQYEPDYVKACGFTCVSIGRKSVSPDQPAG